jgi:hypothetical protein
MYHIFLNFLYINNTQWWRFFYMSLSIGYVCFYHATFLHQRGRARYIQLHLLAVAFLIFYAGWSSQGPLFNAGGR